MLGKHFNCSSCQEIWESGPGKKLKTKPSLDLSLWGKSPLSSWGEGKKLVCYRVRSVVHSALPFPGNRSQHLWFPVTPATETMKMRSSRGLILRQRREPLSLEDVRYEVTNLASRVAIYIPGEQKCQERPLDPTIYYQPFRNPPLISHLDIQQ